MNCFTSHMESRSWQAGLILGFDCLVVWKRVAPAFSTHEYFVFFLLIAYSNALLLFSVLKTEIDGFDVLRRSTRNGSCSFNSNGANEDDDTLLAKRFLMKTSRYPA